MYKRPLSELNSILDNHNNKITIVQTDEIVDSAFISIADGASLIKNHNLNLWNSTVSS